MSGMIVDRRDHDLMTFFSLFSLSASTFFRRWSSTKGPFLRERGMLVSYRREPRVRRRRTIMSVDFFFLLRVRPSGLPQGETGWRPPEVLPSPPPWGWSTGFITTPRDWGRTTFQRLRPALPRSEEHTSELQSLMRRQYAV